MAFVFPDLDTASKYIQSKSPGETVEFLFQRAKDPAFYSFKARAIFSIQKTKMEDRLDVFRVSGGGDYYKAALGCFGVAFAMSQAAKEPEGYDGHFSSQMLKLMKLRSEILMYDQLARSTKESDIKYITESQSVYIFEKLIDKPAERLLPKHAAFCERVGLLRPLLSR